MTVADSSSTVCGMPARENDPYDPDKIRAHMLVFMAERGLKPRPWAEKAQISDGALRNFLGITKTGRPLKKPTDAPQIDLFVRLAHAAGVTVSELLGEAPPSAPAPQDQVSSERQLELEQIVGENEQKILDLYRRNKALRDAISRKE